MKWSLFAICLTASKVLAQPHQWRGYQHCLSQRQVTDIIDEFVSILKHQDWQGHSPNETAHALIADDYKESSDSILSLMGKPLGGYATSSKAEWIAGTLGHPANPDVETLDALPAGCRKIVWHWRFPKVGSNEYPVKGFNLFTINDRGQISEADIEFNSIAWGIDTKEMYQYCPKA
ncbi:hypothetical protein K470DRAFT_35519 [Piedraia hortae CBS 480.64]|uniref:NTF2-like domain-containing protein n=1 Tax=Piedraia hortae CBS 480.64 TaxID=1314780 RepID=A0A6A7C3Y5_9PEZI|nr:hypothetical protein K470DRAFT_35519 [Piedraia hortae CBS 480.64]